jgi:hypothetical protein
MRNLRLAGSSESRDWMRKATSGSSKRIDAGPPGRLLKGIARATLSAAGAYPFQAGAFLTRIERADP